VRLESTRRCLAQRFGMEVAPFGLSRILPHPRERLHKLTKEGPQVGSCEILVAETMCPCYSQMKQNGTE
jgi:hypothetical protein